MLGSNKDPTPTQTIPPQKPNQPTAPPKPASTRKPEPPEPKPTNTGAIPKKKTCKKPGIVKIKEEKNETTVGMSDLRKYFKPRVEQPTELNSDRILNFVFTAPLESEAEGNQNGPTDHQTKPEGSQSTTAKENN